MYVLVLLVLIEKNVYFGCFLLFNKLDEVIFTLEGMVRIRIRDGFRGRFARSAGVFSYSMEVEKM